MDQKQIERLSQQLASSDAIVIGAGAGLSTSAGFTYTGERFVHYFPDFIAKYHFSDMYSGGFYLLIRWKNIGLIGVDTFSAIVIWMPRSRFIKNYCI